VPENKPGASGLIAAADAANAAPDGYTLFVSGVGGLIISSAISSNPPADVVTGYTHIADFGGPPAVLVANKDIPARNLAEFVAYAKANPGKLNYGSPSPGSLANLAFALFQKEIGIALQNVTYRGASQAMTDLMGGHIAVTSTALTSAAGTIVGGRYAHSRSRRGSGFPTSPTFRLSQSRAFPRSLPKFGLRSRGPRASP